jgi:hypothetical protein
MLRKTMVASARCMRSLAAAGQRDRVDPDGSIPRSRDRLCSRGCGHISPEVRMSLLATGRFLSI